MYVIKNLESELFGENSFLSNNEKTIFKHLVLEGFWIKFDRTKVRLNELLVDIEITEYKSFNDSIRFRNIDELNKWACTHFEWLFNKFSTLEELESFFEGIANVLYYNFRLSLEDINYILAYDSFKIFRNVKNKEELGKAVYDSYFKDSISKDVRLDLEKFRIDYQKIGEAYCINKTYLFTKLDGENVYIEVF